MNRFFSKDCAVGRLGKIATAVIMYNVVARSHQRATTLKVPTRFGISCVAADTVLPSAVLATGEETLATAPSGMVSS